MESGRLNGITVDFWFCFSTDIIWASMRQNLFSGFLTKPVSNQYPQLQRLARKLKIRLLEGYIRFFLKKRITKALIRLGGCAVWSAPVSFANSRRQVFSRQGPFTVCPFFRSTNEVQHLKVVGKYCSLALADRSWGPYTSQIQEK